MQLLQHVCVCAFGLTGSDDSFAGGDNLTHRSVGSDHSVIRLSTLQVVHRKLGARHVGLQHEGVVGQTRHHHLKVDKELGVRAAPTQLQATGGDVRDVQLFCIWDGERETQQG